MAQLVQKLALISIPPCIHIPGHCDAPHEDVEAISSLLESGLCFFNYQNVMVYDFQGQALRSFIALTLVLGPLPICHENQLGLVYWSMGDHWRIATWLQSQEGAPPTPEEEPLS